MRTLLILLLSLTGVVAHARTYFVYDGRVAMGRRADARAVTDLRDVEFSKLLSANARVARTLNRLNPAAVFRCQLSGNAVLVGVEPTTGAMISQFRARAVKACRRTSARAMLTATQDRTY